MKNLIFLCCLSLFLNLTLAAQPEYQEREAVEEAQGEQALELSEEAAMSAGLKEFFSSFGKTISSWFKSGEPPTCAEKIKALYKLNKSLDAQEMNEAHRKEKAEYLKELKKCDDKWLQSRRDACVAKVNKFIKALDDCMTADAPPPPPEAIPKKVDRPASDQAKKLAIAKQSTMSEDPYAQSLLAFLDSSEIASGKAPFTKKNSIAIYQKASPILTTGHLLSIIFGDPEKGIDKRIDTVKALLKVVRDEFDARQWTVKRSKIAPEFFLLIPARNPKREEIGIKLEQFEDIDTGEKNALDIYFKDKYGEFFKNANAADLSARFIEVFKNMFIPREEYEKKGLVSPHWVIYLGGHGGTDYSIAGLSVRGENSEFQQLLAVLDRVILPKFFVYDSCQSAGFNSQKIYGDLSSTVGIRTHSFPISVGAVADASTYAGKIELNKQGRIDTEVHYDDFVGWAKMKRINFEESLMNLFPIIKIDQNERWEGEMAGLALLRPANAPAWFPVLDSEKALFHIGRVMALTRKDPLIIERYKFGLRSVMKVPKAILLATTERVRSPIVIDIAIKEEDKTKEKLPFFISLTPGLSVHKIARLELPNQQFSPNALLGGMDYGATKVFWFEKLKDSSAEYDDVIIETEDRKVNAYATKGGRYQKIAGDDLPNYVEYYKKMAEKMLRSSQAGTLILDVNKVERGETPLMEAIYRHDEGSVKILLNAGADVMLRVNGLSPLEYANLRMKYAKDETEEKKASIRIKRLIESEIKKRSKK